ncbi:sensor histidine kinase [Streptomyces sp. FH025]|uniref:sensor histidine kinase n=1 Tax=Streptomyces sp. FH025 TaxID=2815937 RepID=UPI001A9EEF8A|nr:sensor histidine kinase [Streptomyces sp. FH025]MBO1418406.1 sensor histidine kinase [Streptomyces sp. FH025]
MRSPHDSWTSLSKPQRSELYLRWSLYLMALFLPVGVLLAAGAIAQTPGQDTTAVIRVCLVLALATTLVLLRAYRTALDHYLRKSGGQIRWIAVSLALPVAGSWAVLLLGPGTTEGPGGPPATMTVVAELLTLSFGPTCVGLSPRLAAALGLGTLLLVGPAVLLAGTNLATTTGFLVGVAVTMTLIGASCRSFAWLTSVVWELDAAREAQSRLAVAEERLRFSRDLHDVMGRNLTTIALKSELAVQLAKRGRPEAADQMAEVQKIAQESQREVRDVIRGYRTADLHAEAIGARAVLRSADVVCEIDLGEDADRLPVPVQSVLGWVIREATTNVLRHSEAARCLIRLRQEDGRAVLELENDGVPDVPFPSQGSGTGLRGLRERLAAHDGELAVPTAEAGTFRMLATVPLPG